MELVYLLIGAGHGNRPAAVDYGRLWIRGNDSTNGAFANGDTTIAEPRVSNARRRLVRLAANTTSRPFLPILRFRRLQCVCLGAARWRLWIDARVRDDAGADRGFAAHHRVRRILRRCPAPCDICSPGDAAADLIAVALRHNVGGDGARSGAERVRPNGATSPRSRQAFALPAAKSQEQTCMRIAMPGCFRGHVYG